MALDAEFSQKPSRWRRLAGLLLLVAILGGGGFGGWYYFIRDTSTPTPTTLAQEATAAMGNLVTSFTSTGTANPQVSSKLAFGTLGQVVSVSVALGDNLTAGQELARLDDKTATRSLQTASLNLSAARLKLTQLTNPPTAADVAAARAAVATAQSQLATAQNNLYVAQGHPAQSDIDSANNAIQSAETALTNAKNGVDASYASLLNAQRAYCSNTNTQANVCLLADVPLSDFGISQLNQEISNPLGTASEQSAIVKATQGLLSANQSYLTAKDGVVAAQQNLGTANGKKATLLGPPTDLQLTQLNSAVTNAAAQVLSAQAKLDQLLAGPLATDLASAQQSVQQAQIAYDTAQDGIDALILRAPFDGVIGAMTLNVGDQASADSVTITNPAAMRVDLTVSETDLPNVKRGEYGVATFAALAGNTYLLKVTSLGTTPTVTQGVVTYPVQAIVMRTADIQKDAEALSSVASALATLGGGSGGRGGANGAGGGGGANASRTPGANASRTPGANASRTPAADSTRGTNRTPGANGGGSQGGGGGGGILALLGSAPLPSQGMSASVTMLASVKSNVLLLPTGAIKRQGTTRYVVVKNDDGTTKNVNVTIGGADGTNTEIASGITEGTKVVLGATTAATGTTPTTGNAGGGGFQFGPGGGGGRAGGD
jgi:HlyD family secretion protein